MRGEMNLLAIETSSAFCSVALAHDGKIIEGRAANDVTHSRAVLGLIDDLLSDANLALGDLSGIAFGAGPGGFTGLRLGCAVAQGLAFAARLPVFPVGSLEALALNCAKAQVYACVDARMNEVYCAAYRGTSEGLECILEPLVAAPAQIPAAPGAGWHGAGSGFAAYGGQLAQRLGTAIVSVDAAALPTAAAVARIGLRHCQLGTGVDAALATPLYVRDKVALTSAERLARGVSAR